MGWFGFGKSKEAGGEAPKSAREIEKQRNDTQAELGELSKHVDLIKQDPDALPTLFERLRSRSKELSAALILFTAPFTLGMEHKVGADTGSQTTANRFVPGGDIGRAIPPTEKIAGNQTESRTVTPEAVVESGQGDSSDLREHARDYKTYSDKKFNQHINEITDVVQQETLAFQLRNQAEGLNADRLILTIESGADITGISKRKEKLAGNLELSTQNAEAHKEKLEKELDKISKTTGIPKDHIEIRTVIVPNGERLPKGPDGKQFENKDAAYDYMQQQLGLKPGLKDRTKLMDTIHDYLGWKGKQIQDKQPASTKKLLKTMLDDERGIKLSAEMQFPEIDRITPDNVSASTHENTRQDGNDQSGRPRAEIRSQDGGSNPYRVIEYGEEHERPVGEEPQAPREPEPKEPEPDTTPEKNPPIPNNPPKPRWKPKTVIPVTPPRWIEPSYVPPEPTQPPVRPREVPPVIKIKLEPRPRPEPIPIKPRPKLPRRPDVPLWIPPRPRRPDVPPPPPPPPPPPFERKAVMQGQGNPEIQATKRSRPGTKEFRAAKDDVDSLKNVGTELKQNTGRGNVVIDKETGDAKSIGSRQANARERSEGAGHGDKSQSSKEESKDKKSARALKKTHTGK